MKREIKFRAWDGTKMHCPVSLKEDGTVFSNLWSTINWDVMQYTGLKDKNGKELYFDDIVEIHKYKFTATQDDFGIPVFYANGAYESWDFLEFFNNNDRDDFEIIGNIYQNPELGHKNLNRMTLSD